MDRGEREAVLSLVPYFDQDYRVVFDVGSNKGEFLDLLVHNVDYVEIFEPNLKLIHYTEIKYAHLRHIWFNNIAIGNKGGIVEFYEFQHEYNGLSSLFYNERWKDIHSWQRSCGIDKLDNTDRFFDFNQVDFLKIDVEGSEWEVIQGAEQLLKENRIKFIQIEYSEHYQVPGYTFQQIIDFVVQFGYLLYDFNGRNFFRPEFVENYERKNYYFMQEFTEDWNHEFRKNTLDMKFDFALEIGCFEGLTTCYICDFLLNSGGRIICIDPLQDEYLTENIDQKAEEMNEDFKQFKGQYERFIRNTKEKPVELKRMTSTEAFNEEGFNEYNFDFIYIDGDHRQNAVYTDAVNAWEVLKQGGHILFDDYKWDSDTKRGIDRFLRDFGGYFTIIIKSYQVMIRKNVIE